jgi:hypothetical protein
LFLSSFVLLINGLSSGTYFYIIHQIRSITNIYNYFIFLLIMHHKSSVFKIMYNTKLLI